jgi:hypothetical protein
MYIIISSICLLLTSCQIVSVADEIRAINMILMDRSRHVGLETNFGGVAMSFLRSGKMTETDVSATVAH